ncbi:MAG: nitrile hydratase subunit beta, partial [Alphaproteobacteria bacterium]|nr:nitrile hydratase subunit beta [Alphaproteobacteria bacterium]
TRPYYDQWQQTYAAMMVNSSVATVEEISTGRMNAPVTGLRPPMAPEDVENAKKANKRFDRKIDEPPAFSVGDTVRTQTHGATGHTRLPAYARGRRGTIEALHGAHILPDSKAHGGDLAEPLYTVGFDAAELWPDAEDARDRINLNLWQSYLERA